MAAAAATPRIPAPAWLRELGLVLLVLVAVFAIARVHYAGQTLARGPDQADMLLAFFHEASHAIEEEGLLTAMYTQGVRAGESNWSNPNYHMLYPLYFNWAGADASPAATLDRLNFIIMLHLALFAAGAYALARALGVRVLPALVVALAIPWFPALRAAASWPHIIAGMAWLPWVIAAQVRLYRQSGWRLQLPTAVALSTAAILLVHAHPAQNLVFATWASGWLWILVAAQATVARDRQALQALLRSSGWLAGAAALTLAATWPYLSEVLAFLARSIRWLGDVGGHVVGTEAVPVEALRRHALPLQDAGLLLAFEYRRGIGNAYVGAALVLAALCVMARHLPATAATRCARAMLACALVALLFCFAFMAPVLSALPLANKVRELTWWSCLAVTLLLPVAALGLQAMRTRPLPAAARDPWLLAVALGLVVAAFAILAAGKDYAWGAIIALLLALGALAWCLRAAVGNRQPAFVAACALLFFASAWAPFRHNIRFPHDDAMLFHPDRVQAHADAGALARRLGPELDRYRFVLGPVDNAHLLTHAWSTHGFRSIHGGIGPAVHAKYALLSQAGPMVQALYGVRWSLWPDGATQPGDERLREGLWLRTHADAMPRLFLLTGGLEVVEDPVEHLRALDHAGASPLRAVVHARDLPRELDPLTHAGEGRLESGLVVDHNQRSLLQATVDASGPSLLVLGEDPAARWRASIDGHEATTFPVNGYQTAVVIPAAGRYTVRIERPARLFNFADRGPGPAAP